MMIWFEIPVLFFARNNLEISCQIKSHIVMVPFFLLASCTLILLCNIIISLCWSCWPSYGAQIMWSHCSSMTWVVECHFSVCKLRAELLRNEIGLGLFRGKFVKIRACSSFDVSLGILWVSLGFPCFMIFLENPFMIF